VHAQLSSRAPMSMRPGRHAFSAKQGRITLRTSRDGLAAQAGDDLAIDVNRWSGELTVAADGRVSGTVAAASGVGVVVTEDDIPVLTELRGARIVDLLVGDPLLRIC